jgi:succinate dehydrogenase / fumarate reductase iron-sulfur subunit
MKELRLSLYRYDPEKDARPYMSDYVIEMGDTGNMMVIDAIRKAQEQDSTVTFRRSCAQGVCGSDGVNMNGQNGLACITAVSNVAIGNKLEVRPLPGLPVIKDLIVDMKPFYDQYEKIKPFLDNDDSVSTGHERLQSPEDRDKLDGLYECVLCACCSTSCPSFWWNPEKFVGPAALLQAYRFIADTRDKQKINRLKKLNDAFSVYRCHGIMNCTAVCPKGLNPSKAINEIKKELRKIG